MSSSEVVSIPLLDQLIPGGIRVGKIFVVEFDPQSQWLAVGTTMGARYLQANGRVGYVAATRHPADVKQDLAALGVDVSAAQKEGRLTVDDWYSATLTGGRLESSGGQSSLFEPIEGGMRVRSLKIADLSLEWLKWQKYGFQADDVMETWPPGALALSESASEMLRFNEENATAEYMVTRVIPNERRGKRVSLFGFVRGIHSESFYKRMEAASDGVIDVRVMERGDEAMTLLRLTSFKGQKHDARWHEIQIRTKGEAVLTT